MADFFQLCYIPVLFDVIVSIKIFELHQKGCHRFVFYIYKDALLKYGLKKFVRIDF